MTNSCAERTREAQVPGARASGRSLANRPAFASVFGHPEIGSGTREKINIPLRNSRNHIGVTSSGFTGELSFGIVSVRFRATRPYAGGAVRWGWVARIAGMAALPVYLLLGLVAILAL